MYRNISCMVVSRIRCSRSEDLLPVSLPGQPFAHCGVWAVFGGDDSRSADCGPKRLCRNMGNEMFSCPSPKLMSGDLHGYSMAISTRCAGARSLRIHKCTLVRWLYCSWYCRYVEWRCYALPSLGVFSVSLGVLSVWCVGMVRFVVVLGDGYSVAPDVR